MKNIVFLISVLLVLACSENENDLAVTTVEGHYLNVDLVKDYLPDFYFNEAVIVYKNSTGEEWTLNTTSNESVREKTYEGAMYKAGNFEVNLFDPDNLNFHIVLTGSAQYSSAGIGLNLGGILMPFNASGTTWNSVRFVNGEPVVGLGDDFNESITLYGRTFQDVFVRIGKDGFEQHEAYSELDLNSKEGVVAFRDENNELWVFDRVEE